MFFGRAHLFLSARLAARIRRLRARALALAFALLALAGCWAPNQDPADSFVDGKLPPALAEIATQSKELFAHLDSAGREALVARAAADRRRKDLLRVMVIDNGVDLAHPDLRGQIEFDVRDGRIVGAGRDFMGDSAFGTSNLIDPRWFAFGAQRIVDGKIAGPPAQPLELMAELNAAFMARLEAAIRADRVLAGSLFARISARNLSVFGAIRFAEDADREAFFREQKRDGLLYGPGMRERARTNPRIREKLKRASFQATLHELLEHEWEMSPKDGLPILAASEPTLSEIPSRLALLEHGDRFAAVVRRTLDGLPERDRLEAAIGNYTEFMKHRRDADEDTQGRSARERALGELAGALFAKQHGYRATDPLHELHRALHGLALQLRHIRGGESARTGEPSTEELRGALEFALDFQDSFAAFALANSSHPGTLRTQRRIRESVATLRELADWWLRERGFDQAGALRPWDHTPQSSLYRELLLRTSHPYYARQSATRTHGTHVSGIIARQDPDIRIVPVRVTTERTTENRDVLARRKARFKEELQSWLRLPLVFRAIGKAAGELFPEIDFSGGELLDRYKLANALMRAFDERIEISFTASDGDIEHRFIDEVMEAIRLAGRERIKLVNVSLGTKWEAPVDNLDQEDPDEKREALFDFLRYEFHKYRVGSVIARDAPKSLFFIAAGNEANWVDGDSRSALPVDISSPFLLAAETETERAPNNHLDNVVGVMSLKPQLKLSSFTNLILSPMPVIFAQGESILSPIKTLDTESVTQILTKALPTWAEAGQGILVAGDEDLERFADEAGLIPAGADPEARKALLANIKPLVAEGPRALQQLLAAIETHLFVSRRPSRARMSGTSMAAPVAVGVTAARIVQPLARELGVPLSEIYDHPEFAPARIIDRIYDHAPKVGGNRLLSIQALIGQLEWDRGDVGRELEGFLGEAKARAQARGDRTMAALTEAMRRTLGYGAEAPVAVAAPCADPLRTRRGRASAP